MEDEEVPGPRLVRRKVFANTPRLCVVCLTPLQKLSGLGGWLVPQDYLCPKCGYRGYVYLEAARDQPQSEREPDDPREPAD